MRHTCTKICFGVILSLSWFHWSVKSVISKCGNDHLDELLKSHICICLNRRKYRYKLWLQYF